MNLRLFFGDLHCHCGISYGQGSLDRALAIARGHLDFCSITGHAVWQDMPSDREQYGHIIDFHNEGFTRFAGMLDEVKAKVEAANEDGAFVTFHSYEWHNCFAGDHNIYHLHPNWEIEHRDTLEEMRASLRQTGGLIIPHHIGYVQGSRGINWDAFDEGLSPFCEIMSMHGCSESDSAPYPMLHSMGPRDFRSTAEFGFMQGHKFGLVAGTDHHSGFPGSFGDGCQAVWAEDLTRESLWEAFKARRVYALTGDHIGLAFSVNGQPMGSVVENAPEPTIEFAASGCDWIDYVELLKNGNRVALFEPEPDWDAVAEAPVLQAKIRIEWGWGSKDKTLRWEGHAKVLDGQIMHVQPCFRGDPILSPDDFQDDPEGVPHEVLEQSDSEVRWRSQTRGNPTVRHANTQALVLSVVMPRDGKIALDVNGKKIEHTLEELIEGARVTMMRGVITEAVRIGAAPNYGSVVAAGYEDGEDPEQEVEYYQVRVRQHNDQWAWSTPIWVQRG